MHKEEIWKPIKGFESLYEVSSEGRVKALSKSITYKDGRVRQYNEIILKQGLAGGGYPKVGLTKDKTLYNKNVHRLVAEAFLPNTDISLEVNHIDENKLNNSISNLEWCTRKENNHYSSITENLNDSKKVPVNQLSIDGKFVKKWDGIRDAARGLGMKTHKHISECCVGRESTCYGYKWEYAES